MSNELKEWCCNTHNNIINNNLLLLCIENRNILIEINDYIIKKKRTIKMVRLTNLIEEIDKNDNENDKKIIVAYNIKDVSFGNLGILKWKSLKIILMKITNSQQFIQLLSFDNLNVQFEPFLVLGRHKPEEVISSLNGINFIDSFISDFIGKNKYKCSMNDKSIEHYLYRRPSISRETILNDLKFLRYKSILTSRLAIFIYKICTFEYDASDKEIGVYFSKYFGRSRGVNSKAFGISNVKGYIIRNINFQEQQIRIDIANKLQQRGVQQDIINYATGVKFQ